MAVHSFHVFDRKGQTLFTKRYGGSSKALSDGSNKSSQNNKSKNNRKNEDAAQLSEQRKLVFGMLFSLRELSGSLSPSEGPGDLQVMKTGASFLYHYETVSGLRFVLYASTPEYSYTHSLYDANRGGSGGGGLGSGGSGGNSSNHGSVGGETGGGGASLPQASASNSAVGGSSAAGGAAGGGSGSGSGAAGLPNNQATTTHQEATGSGGLSGGAGAGGSSAQSSKKEANASDVRNSLRHIYETLWVGCVVRSPMYRPTKARESIAATGFEAELDKYLKQKTWFR